MSIKPEHIPNNAVKAALETDGLDIREAIAAALNAWPQSIVVPDDDFLVDAIKGPAIILPLGGKHD
jgi:hypothetical protein